MKLTHEAANWGGFLHSLTYTPCLKKLNEHFLEWEKKVCGTCI